MTEENNIRKGTFNLRTEGGIRIKGSVPKLGVGDHVINEVNTKLFKKSFKAFLLELEEVLESQPNNIAGFEIDKLELSLAVSATGGVELIGKLSAGMTSSIKLTLQRSKG